MSTKYVVPKYSGSGSAISNYFAAEKEDNENWGTFKKSNKKHMVILSLCRQAQWITRVPKFGEVADLEKLSAFLKSDKSPVKKPLIDMTDAECEKVIVALNGIVKSKFKSR